MSLFGTSHLQVNVLPLLKTIRQGSVGVCACPCLHDHTAGAIYRAGDRRGLRGVKSLSILPFSTESEIVGKGAPALTNTIFIAVAIFIA